MAHQQQLQQPQPQQQQQQQQQQQLPPGQRQGPPQSPLDLLQAMLNLVLMQVGDILSSPAKRKDHHRRAGLHNSITLAKSRFQENLDRFEADLFRAKAVMRRDLALFLAAREQRERDAALAEKAQEKATLPVNTAEEKKESSQATVQDKDTKKADEVMGGVEESAPAQQTTTSSERDAKSIAEDWTSALPTSNAAAPSSLTADLFTSTSPSADVKDFDFDSMFEDLTNTSPQNLTADASFDAGGAFDTGQSGGGSGHAEASGDMTDVNDLLQGIEGYGDIPDAGDTKAQQSTEAAAVHDDGVVADTGFDISMLDLPADGKQDGEDIGENTFDELFDLADFELGDAPVDGDGLDDDWLKELEAS